MSQSRARTTPGSTITRAPSPRITNLTLLLALLITFATGIGAVANGSASGRWVVIGHGVAAMMGRPADPMEERRDPSRPP